MRRPTAATLARDLPATWTVRAGTERLTVSTAPIVDALTATTPESSWVEIRTAAVARIDALREEASPLARAGVPPRRTCAARWRTCWRRRSSGAGSATPG